MRTGILTCVLGKRLHGTNGLLIGQCPSLQPAMIRGLSLMRQYEQRLMLSSLDAMRDCLCIMLKL